ncbi:MAG TPA: glycosyltransferase, partial [Thermoguttaceae bacterium]
YMAAGLPVVANPVGVHREMIIHGKTGFLATTPQQWADSIVCLAADPELRNKMGNAGRELIEQRYNVGAWGPRFADLLHGYTKSIIPQIHHGENAVVRKISA